MKYWLSFIILILISVLFLKQGMDLWKLGTDVDGDGIGVHFLAFEINDSVPEANIPSYAIGFFVAAGLTLGLILGIFGRKIWRVKTWGIFGNGRKSSSD